MVYSENLVLRCYAYRTPRNTWIAKCIDLDLVTEEDSLPVAKKSLEEAIEGYIETVLDTEDKESIPRLLQRKAPLVDRMKYELLKSELTRRLYPKKPVPFLSSIPFHLAHTC